jgi:hypothetical protein
MYTLNGLEFNSLTKALDYARRKRLGGKLLIVKK